jgi:hypothetical protein
MARKFAWISSATRYVASQLSFVVWMDVQAVHLNDICPPQAYKLVKNRLKTRR